MRASPTLLRLFLRACLVALVAAGLHARAALTATPVPGTQLGHIAVASDGTTWGVTLAGAVVRRTGVTIADPMGTGWDTVPTPELFSRVAVASANLAWGIAASDNIYHWNGTAWQQVAGAAAKVSIGSDGTVWVLNGLDQIYRRLGTSGTPAGTGWEAMPGGLSDVAVRRATQVWGTNAADQIWYWNGAYSQVAGTLDKVSVAADGTVWGVDAGGALHYRDGVTEATPTGSAWVGFGSGASQVAVRNMSGGWSLDAAGNVSHWFEAGFTPHAPAPPGTPVATAGDTQASVAFPGSPNHGGSEITHYTVTSNPGGITATGAASPIVVTGLTNGQAYTFTVTATNGVGTSLASPASNSVTPAVPPSVPGAPTIGVATVGEGYAVVEFTPPASDGGSAITGYTATSDPPGFSASGAASPLVVTGLPDGAAYTFTVTATNGVGTGAASAASNAVTSTAPTFTPTAVPGLSLFDIAVASDGSLWGVDGATLAPVRRDGIASGTPTGTGWTAFALPLARLASRVAVSHATAVWVLDTGGGIWFGPGDGTWQPITGTADAIAAASDGSVWVTNLGNIYRRLGTGTTPEGTGWENVLGGLAEVSVRRADQAWGTNAANDVWHWTGSFQQVAGSLDRVSVAADGTTWGTLSNAIVRRRGAGDVLPTGLSWTPLGAAGSRVAVHNAVSAWSIDGGTLTYWSAAPIPPTAPSNVVATAGAGEASVAFDAPASDGGSAITGYTVTSSPGGHTATGTSSPIVVANLPGNVSYTFTVTATNGVGTGPASAPSNSVLVTLIPQVILFPDPGAKNYGSTPTLVASTTSGLAPIFTSLSPAVCTVSPGGVLTTVRAGPCTIEASQPGDAFYAAASSVPHTFTITALLPGAPVIGMAAAGAGQATITFLPPASDGGTSVIGYTATCTPGPIAATGAGSPLVVGGLANGTAYACSVTATNAVGTGPASGVASVTPVTNTYSAMSATGSGIITASFTGGGAGCGYTNARFIPVEGDAASPPPGSAPNGVVFPHGLFDFTTGGCNPGDRLDFTIVYPAPLPPGTLYWKYGPTPTDATRHWYVLPATVAGNTITFSIVDGQLGDDDLAPNGIVVDQGGPGAGGGGVEQVPTLGGLALLALALLMLGGASMRARRGATPARSATPPGRRAR